jgi:parvulin-like peptidyl-prolyl isomerase
MVILLVILGNCGCKGRSLKVPNPVFADAPPRRSLVNQTADAEEQRLAMGQAATGTDVQQIGFSKNNSGPLTGTTVVADVNGKPVFVDDVLGGARQIIESDPRLPESKRQEVIEATLRKRLPKYVEDELIVQALEKKIPEDKRDAIKETLEPQFQKVIAGIKEKEGFVTDQQLDERLAKEGISVDALRDNFLRMQMVEGYIGTSIKVPETIDREVLVSYYQEHINDYKPVEEVRFAEIVIRFRDHGGREGAEQAMTNVVTQLQSGKDFGDVAQALSDTMTAEKRGEIGWIKRGSLTDKALEDMLFEMPDGEISSVQVRSDRFEVYKVIDHRDPGTIPFQEGQKEIETTLLNEMKLEARQKVRRDIREKGNVNTIFGESFEKEFRDASKL